MGTRSEPARAGQGGSKLPRSMKRRSIESFLGVRKAFGFIQSLEGAGVDQYLS